MRTDITNIDKYLKIFANIWKVRRGHDEEDLRDRLLPPPLILGEHLPEEEGEDDQDGG